MRIKEGLETEYQEYVAKNADAYGSGVVEFTEAWAAIMEKSIAEGAADAEVLAWLYEGTIGNDKYSDNGHRSSHEADTSGITGFMYGCAVAALAHFWRHGEPLRRWHNKGTQIGTEGDRANETGGVLNPAILNIG